MPTLLFDEQDIQILAERFTLSQLRAERDSAQIHTKVAEFWDEADTQYWHDYLEVVELTIKRILQAQRQELIANPPAKGHIDIESIKAKNDVVDVIARYVKLRKAGKRFQGLCPFHDDKDTPSLVVYPDKQNWHCFGCQKRGDVIDFVAALEHTDFKGAVQKLGG